MAAQRGEGAVDLLGQHHAREFVREGHRRQRQQQVRAWLPFGRKTVVAAQQEDQVLRRLFCLGDQLDEAGRVATASRWIEKNLARCGVAREQIETAGSHFAHFAGGIASAALDELSSQRISRRVAWLADEIKEELHTALTGVLRWDRHHSASGHKETMISVKIDVRPAVCACLLFSACLLGGCGPGEHGSRFEPLDVMRSLPLNTIAAPLRTIREMQWSAVNKGWGLHDVDVWQVERTEALRGDRSMLVSLHVVTKHHWIFTALDQHTTFFNLIPQNKLTMLDQDHKTYVEHDGARSNGFYEVLERKWDREDPDCLKKASHILYLSRHLAKSMFAGLPALGFWGEDDQHGQLTIYLAPSRGCEPLYRRYEMKNSWGAPTYLSVRQVVSYHLGEPAPWRFEVPSDYREATRARPF